MPGGHDALGRWRCTMNPILVALFISLGANGLLGWAYLGQRDRTSTAQADLRGMVQQRDGARAAASACSDAVEDLRTLADKRAKDAGPVRAAAASVARGHERRADYTLSLKPRVPGDACASMQALGDEWLRGRASP